MTGPVEAHARRTDPETSQSAARRARLGLGRLEFNVWEALCAEAQTTKELASLLGVDRDSISPRIKPLRKRGLIHRTQLRRDGCIVWQGIPKLCGDVTEKYGETRFECTKRLGHDGPHSDWAGVTVW